MSKTKQLKEIFAAWKRDPELPAGDFYTDGIINENLFDSCPVGSRLLFVTKEPNATNHDQNGDKSFITEWDNKRARYPFACRIGEWAYGILNKFPLFDNIKDDHRQETLRRIAFMNVKKSGGTGSTNHKMLLKEVKRTKDFLARQIEIINPEIVVLGLSFDLTIIREIFEIGDWKETGYSVKVAVFNRAKVVSFYHPSFRTVPAASYSLLQNVIQSEAFKNL